MNLKFKDNLLNIMETSLVYVKLNNLINRIILATKSVSIVILYDLLCFKKKGYSKTGPLSIMNYTLHFINCC